MHRTIQSLVIWAFTFSLCCPLLASDDKLCGVWFTKDRHYETTLGKLESRFLLENDNKVEQSSSGSHKIIFGYMHIDKTSACNLKDEVNLYLGYTKYEKSFVTLVQSVDGIWLATDGVLVTWKDKPMLMEGTIVRIIGGGEKPIIIAGGLYSNTTVQIINGEVREISK